jgi:RNase P subunit RPR2
VADDSARGQWYFGVLCEQCSTFLPVRRDESGGRPGAKLAASGTIIATCHACGRRGRYGVNRLEQRRTEPRPPKSDGPI